MDRKIPFIFLFLAASFILVMLSLPLHPASAQTGHRLHEPLVIPNDTLSTGQETIWSCITFGRYPSAEVVRSSWDSVDSYALRDGDVIRDDELYTRLTEAEWSGDRLTLDGQNYIRISRTDAVTAAPDRDQHYRWEDPDEWHYFAEQPIKWRILSLKNGKALLLSDRTLDCSPFNLTDEEVSWQNSTVRSWLNGYDGSRNRDGVDYSGKGFLDKAFTPDEQEALLQTVNITPNNPDYETDSGPAASDRVFLLSNEEVFAGAAAADYGFYAGRGFDDPAKRFESTTYAKCRGTWWSPVEEYRGNSFWFMRTSGYTPHNVTYICDFGYVYSRGTTVTIDDAGILPAIRIDLAKADYAYAGEVSSAEIVKEPVYPYYTKTSEEKVMLREPVIEADDTLPGGTAVTWDTVAFGTYPQTGILETGEALPGTETDPALFHMLQTAEWDGDELSLDGKRYRRINGRFFRYDPIIWQVLEIEDNSVLLLSARALDSVQYYH
ncbi:MAG: hypothetical protein IKP86_08260, partial [Anaerolineaceae bacterium]|nr:hypothetical protein [Anaerolineaceae bacterium]